MISFEHFGECGRCFLFKKGCILHAQNERLREQRNRCKNELETLTSFAENTKQWRNSTLFSQSISGVLPMVELKSRTSDDSGLTSDDTSGDKTATHSLFTEPRVHTISEIPNSRPSLMTQSLTTSTRSPRRALRAAPNSTQLNASLNQSSNDSSTLTNSTVMNLSIMNGSATSTVRANASSSPDSSSSSPFDEKQLVPIPVPRKVRPIMGVGGQMLLASKARNEKNESHLIERDSLNEVEYYGDEDEIFDEIDCAQSTAEQSPSSDQQQEIVRKRNSRCADYVNLADFCVIRDSSVGNDASLPYVYSDIGRVKSEQPELPQHRPFMKWEQKLYRTAEKCLSFVEPTNSLSNSPCCSSPHGRGSPAVLSKNSSGEIGFLKQESSLNVKMTPTRQPKQCTPPNDSDSGLGRGSGNSSNGMTTNLMPLDELATNIPGMSLTHEPVKNSDALNAEDYAIPPDATPNPTQSPFASKPPSMTLPRNSGMTRDTLLLSNNSSPMHLPSSSAMRTSLIPAHENLERSGYLTQMSESRLRSTLKRRFVVMKNTRLEFYRTAKNQLRNEAPTTSIPLENIQSITRVTTKSGVNGFQICTANDTLRYQAENDKATEDWFNAINCGLRQLTINEMAQKTRPTGSLSGWIIKVKHGHQKRFFAALMGQKLLFFKKQEDNVPCSQVFLQGARVCEKSKGSSDEYSGSDEDPTNNEFALNGSSSANRSSSSSGQQQFGKQSNDYSICIEAGNTDPLYLMLKSSEEKDKWLYYLRMASKDPSVCGTPFEILVQRLMMEPNVIESPLWNDVLLIQPEKKPLDPLTGVEEEALKRKAVEIDVACHLFTAVLMKPVAIQYHVDLAQNILSMALESPALQNELYAQLIRLTSSDMPYTLQAWKLFAMAIPIYLPKQYSVLWLLKHHLSRWKQLNKPTSKMAEFCETLMQKRQKAGDRSEGPSKLEAISILTRDPSCTTLPFSVPIQLPTSDYQVIEFDGSTEIGQCLSSLCLKLSLRPALLSGYALYANDPTSSDNPLILLKNKQKLCDCLTVWERQVKDGRCGRVTDDSCSIKLQLRLRHYWSSLAEDETSTEKIFLCYRMAEELVAGHLPMSNELAEELCALYAQMCHGDINDQVSDQLLDKLTERFYPRKMLDVINLRSLRANLCQNWSELSGVSLNECVRTILTVLRRWRFFGSYIRQAQMKLHPDQKILIAINDQGVHLLTNKQMDVIRSFPFHRLVNFGEFQGDFMLTVSRILCPDSHPEETPRERLTFLMSKESIEQTTMHLSEYIRCQQLIWKLSVR
ncbi:hypothetical protein M3Y97_00089700 [Aphelenchoides bicaudatus]|nr:hypothetical protein M3Y97_00089700 [Aphelenchoides bicaudatus]